MTTLRLSVLSFCLLLSLPPALGETGYTGLKIDDRGNVMEVFSNTPAWRAGIRPGDAIESVDNVPTKSIKTDELTEKIKGPIGSRVTLIILRRGKRYTCVVVRGVSEKATEANSASSQRRGGVYTGLAIDDGNRIASVSQNSPAWIVGIRAGDRIEYINNSPTRDMKQSDVEDLVVNPSGAGLMLRMLRGTQKYYVGLEGGPKPVSLAGRSQSQSSASAQRTTTPTSPPASPSVVKAEAPSIVSIEIFRKTNDTDKVLRQVKDALARVPTSVQESLKRAGISVLIVPTILAARPELANEKPRGYHGGGYDNCAGLFYSQDKKVFVSERVSYRNSPYQENWYLMATAMHELGHAYDHTASYSKAESFIKAYEDDGKYIGNEQRNKFEYFLQENDAGRSEMFAELFQAILSPDSDQHAVTLSKAFPRCTAAVKDAIGYIPPRK